MNYKINITSIAEQDIDSIVFYLLEHLKNKQATRKFLNDIDDAKNLLKSAAESFQLCTNNNLRSLGYRKFYLKSSKYFILYRVEENEVFIDDVFHQSQDYENKIQ